MDDALRALARRFRETGNLTDLLAWRAGQVRADEAWNLDHTSGVGYWPSRGFEEFGPCQADMRLNIELDDISNSKLLHPRSLVDGRMHYRMLGSDELMRACLSNPGLLREWRWSGASYVTRTHDTKFEVRPRCPYLMGVKLEDRRLQWPVIMGELGGDLGSDVFVCDRSDERYSTPSRREPRVLTKEQMVSLDGWIALARGDTKLLSDFADLQRELEIPLGVLWVAEQQGLRPVAFERSVVTIEIPYDFSNSASYVKVN